MYILLNCHRISFLYRKHSPLEEIDAGDDFADLGEEWPAFEKEDVARQREFIQVYIYIMANGNV